MTVYKGNPSFDSKCSRATSYTANSNEPDVAMGYI